MFIPVLLTRVTALLRSGTHWLWKLKIQEILEKERKGGGKRGYYQEETERTHSLRFFMRAYLPIADRLLELKVESGNPSSYSVKYPFDPTSKKVAMF